VKLSGKAKPKGLIREAVIKLDDARLSQLITELRFSTKLQQSTLHTAVMEQRRRRRKAKDQVNP
jgi:hypothetical protein